MSLSRKNADIVVHLNERERELFEKLAGNVLNNPRYYAVLPAPAPSIYIYNLPYSKPLVNRKSLKTDIKEQTCDVHLLGSHNNQIKIKSVKTRRRNGP